MRDSRTRIYPLLMLCCCVLSFGKASGQDLEPRRWTPLPIGLNVLGVGYGRTVGDLFLDPVLQLEDADVEVHTVALSYVRSFSIAGKPLRFDALIPRQNARWEGLLSGVPAGVSRVGLADPILRVSINLVGAPALGPVELRKYVKSRPVNTVVGAAVSVAVPLGEYLEDKLLNLGQNRFTVRPQIGVVHTRGLWSYELTGSIFFHSDNDDFFGGNTREQEPLYAIQAHVTRVFKPGLWASLSAGYGRGAAPR